MYCRICQPIVGWTIYLQYRISRNIVQLEKKSFFICFFRSEILLSSISFLCKNKLCRFSVCSGFVFRLFRLAMNNRTIMSDISLKMSERKGVYRWMYPWVSSWEVHEFVKSDTLISNIERWDAETPQRKIYNENIFSSFIICK